MVHKTVLKVDISDDRWKKKILKAVSGIPGVDIVEADVAKGILTVTGTADPYEIIRRTRKTDKCVEVVSIGPPPKPTEQKKPEEKKPQPEKKPPDEKKPDQKAQAQPQLQLQPFVPQPFIGNNYPPQPQCMGHNYPICDRVAVVYIGRQDEPSPACNIM